MSALLSVVTGLVPAIHVDVSTWDSIVRGGSSAWMPGMRSGMTEWFRLRQAPP